MDYILKYRLLPQWRYPLLCMASSLLAIFVLYLETFSATFSKWINSETYTHGIIVVPIVLYMIWTKKDALSTQSPAPNLYAVFLVLCTVFIWMLGAIIDVLVAQQIAVLLMIWAIVLATLGKEIFKIILFPMMYLAFAIPIGEGLIPGLMDFTAMFTVKALQLTGVPVYWEGMYFSIPGGNFEVAKACSGIRYFSASLTVGSLFAYLNYQSPWRRTVFIIISIVLPILANGIRAYGIVMIAHLSGHKYAVGLDHLIYGWVFFGLIMFVLFYIGVKWQEDRATNLDTQHISEVVHTPGNKYIFSFMAIVLVAIIGPVGVSQQAHPVVMQSNKNLLLPDSVGQWIKVSTDYIDWKPDYKGASHTVRSVYRNGDDRLQVYVAYYQNETQHAELINQANQLYESRAWIQSNKKEIKLPYADSIASIAQKILVSGERRRLLWYMYDLNGFVTHNEYQAKLYQAWMRISGKDKGGAIVALTIDVKKSDSLSQSIMEKYFSDAYPLINLNLMSLRK